MLWTADPFCINIWTLTEILWAFMLYTMVSPHSGSHFFGISSCDVDLCLKNCLVLLFYPHYIPVAYSHIYF